MDRRYRKLLNKDGSFNMEAAVAAGRNARARHVAEGCAIVGDAAAQLALIVKRAFAACYSRISLSRVFQGKAA